MTTAAPAPQPAERARQRARLGEVVRARSLILGKEMKLVSGRTSRFYFNMKETSFDPEGAHLIAELILAALEGRAVDHIGGMEMGAVPIVACVSQRSFEIGRPIPSFFVRKAVKDHGTKRLVEGDLKPGARVVIVEDVTTTGGSALKAAEAVRALGCTVETVVTVVDRLEGAEANLAKHGLHLIALLTAEDFELAG